MDASGTFEVIRNVRVLRKQRGGVVGLGGAGLAHIFPLGEYTWLHPTGLYLGDVLLPGTMMELSLFVAQKTLLVQLMNISSASALPIRGAGNCVSKEDICCKRPRGIRPKNHQSKT